MERQPLGDRSYRGNDGKKNLLVAKEGSKCVSE